MSAALPPWHPEAPLEDPVCASCGKPLKEWLEAFCSPECFSDGGRRRRREVAAAERGLVEQLEEDARLAAEWRASR